MAKTPVRLTNSAKKKIKQVKALIKKNTEDNVTLSMAVETACDFYLKRGGR